MGIDYSKFGLDLDKIKDAALNDFEDYNPEDKKIDKASLGDNTNNESPVSFENGRSGQTNFTNAAFYDFKDYDSENKDEKNTPIGLTDNVIDNSDDDGDDIRDSRADEKASKNPDEDKFSDFKAKLLSFHIVQLFVRLFKKENITLIIWLFVNFAVITALAVFFAGGWGILIGLGLFALSFGIALSPIGEFYLRFTNGFTSLSGKKFGKKRAAKFRNIEKRIMPLFENVYRKAQLVNPNISKKIKLYYNGDEYPNAYATGRKTICITKGLLELSDAEIEAVLSHEFGHLSNKDTDLILMTLVSNLPLIIILLAGQIYLSLLILIAGIFVDDDRWFFKLMAAVVSAPFIALRWIWNKLGTLCLRYSMRKHEYQADNFAVDLGYHEELVEVLIKTDGEDYNSAKGLMAALMSTHPQVPDRIASMTSYVADKKSLIN